MSRNRGMGEDNDGGGPGFSRTATANALSHNDYTVGWICAIPLELSAAKALLDAVHPALPNPMYDQNTYTLGNIGCHNIVIACMSSGVYGMTSATRVATQMRSSFPSLRFGLMVGIGGGAPSANADIRLGDVVVSKPTERFGGVVQYDYGKTVQEGSFARTGLLNKPPEVLLTAISSLQADNPMRPSRIPEFLSEMAAKYPTMASDFANPPRHPDRLFDAHYEHVELESTCDNCDLGRLVHRSSRPRNEPVIHYGLIASANQVMKHAATRDTLARELGILCFEMEAGGLMDNFPCLVIRGICDYSDSHKNKQWQGYAAATAAAYAKELLLVVPTYQDHAATTADRMTIVTEKGKGVDQIYIHLSLIERAGSDVLPAAVTNTGPQASFLLPFRRDPDFVDRPALHEIVRRASEPGARVGVIGLGGVGKSQLAIEYAYRIRDANPNIWIFWVHASTTVRFEESYRNIATYLRLPGLKEPNADVLGMVYKWLSDSSNNKWTMFVDNADDVDIMLEPLGEAAKTTAVSSSANRPLSEFLPLSSNGSIIITSRNREVVSRLQVYDKDIVEVQPMEVDVAKDLLLKKLGKGGGNSDDMDILRLVTELDCMPLAISQAAAFINQRAPRMTVSRYIEVLEKNDRERVTLLQKDVRDSRRDRQASNSIIATWHVTFTYLHKMRDSAARLLSLMCLFDREAIPEHVLRGRYMESFDSETDFEDDIVVLRAYYLIGMGVNENLFDMHRLVQLSTQKWLEMRGELVEWQERYISCIGAFFPTGEYGNWATCHALYPHVDAMKKYRVTDSLHRKIWAEVLFNGAHFVWQRGQYHMAETLVRLSLDVHEELFGRDYAWTLECMELLSLVMRALGRYSEAEEMNRQALMGFETVLGTDHPHTLSSMSKLAGLLDSQGKYSEAEKITRQALAQRMKILGPDHPKTLSSVTQLAESLMSQGKETEAEEMHRRAIAGTEKELGADHPYTLTSLHRLGPVLRKQKKYSEAKELIQRALAGREKVLGASHPHTLTSLNELALLLRDQGDYSEAEKLSKRALAERERVLGVNHPHTLSSVSNLGQLLNLQRKYSEAEVVTRRALEGYEKVVGADHPNTLTGCLCLADILVAREDFDQALTFYRRAAIGYSKVLGPEHPTTLSCQRRLAVLEERLHLSH